MKCDAEFLVFSPLYFCHLFALSRKFAKIFKTRTDTSTASGSKCSRAPLLQAVHHALVQAQGIPYVWGASLRRHPLLHLLGCTVCDLFPDPQLTVVMQSWFTIREPRGSNDAELYVHWHLPNHLRAMLRWPIPFIAQGYDVLAVSRGQLVRGR